MALRLLRYSYGAVRSRSLAAGLMKPEELGDLLDCVSKREAERWLENKLGVRSAPMETGLQGRFVAFGEKIARALPRPARKLILSYLSRGQVEHLKMLCRSLLTGRRQEGDPFPLPDAPEISPGRGFASAVTLEELSERLPRGPYREVVRAERAKGPEELLFRLESGLDRTFWEIVMEHSRSLPLFDRQAAAEILGMRADIERCRVLGRGLRANLAPATILHSLPPFGTFLPSRRVRLALKSDNPPAAVRQLAVGVGGDPLGTEGETFLLRRLSRHLRRTLVSPPFDISVPLSSLLLMELETRDLKSIYGGKRVGAKREDILPFLSIHGV